MKKLFFLFILMPIVLFGQISDFQYDRNILTSSWNMCDLKSRNNNLFLRQQEFINKYQIDEAGDISLEKRLRNNTFVSIYPSYIIGDSLYTTEAVDAINSPFDKIKIIDLANNGFILKDSIFIDDFLYSYKVNWDYIFFNVDSDYLNSKVYDRRSLNYVCSIETGTQFIIKDTLLFIQMVNNNNQTAISLRSINDLNNIYELSFEETGAYQTIRTSYFDNNILYIVRDSEILIMDFSDTSNLRLLSRITNVENYTFSIITWDNYLIFARGNSIWVYDVSDKTDPVFLTHYTDNRLQGYFGNNLAKNDSYIYYVGNKNDIFKIDPTLLPEIEFSNSYEVGYMFFAINNIDDKLLIAKLRLDKYNTYLYNILNNEEPITLMQAQDYYLFPSNDNLLCGPNFKNNTQYIRLFDYQNNSITMTDSIAFNSGKEFYMFNLNENNTLMISDADTKVKLFHIDENKQLEYLTTFNYPSHIFLPWGTSSFTRTDLYILFNNQGSNLKYLSIREDQPPYNEISRSLLNVNNYNEKDIRFLSNDKAILYHHNYDLVTYKLCNYVYPDSFQLLDTYTTDQYFSVHDNLITGIRGGCSNTAHYYIWANDQIEEVYSYDFGFPVTRFIFLPEENKLLAIGYSDVKVYNCQYVTVKDNQITNFYPINISNYPNPFNPSTTITFDIKKLEKNTAIEIYNLKGQKIRMLKINNLKLGINKVIWDGKNDNGKKVSSGVYLYRLVQNGKALATKKMIMIK